MNSVQQQREHHRYRVLVIWVVHLWVQLDSSGFRSFLGLVKFTFGSEKVKSQRMVICSSTCSHLKSMPPLSLHNEIPYDACRCLVMCVYPFGVVWWSSWSYLFSSPVRNPHPYPLHTSWACIKWWHQKMTSEVMDFIQLFGTTYLKTHAKTLLSI